MFYRGNITYWAVAFHSTAFILRTVVTLKWRLLLVSFILWLQSHQKVLWRSSGHQGWLQYSTKTLRHQLEMVGHLFQAVFLGQSTEEWMYVWYQRRYSPCSSGGGKGWAFYLFWFVLQVCLESELCVSLGWQKPMHFSKVSMRRMRGAPDPPLLCLTPVLQP